MSGVSDVTSTSMEDYLKKYQTSTSEALKEAQRTTDKDMFLNLMVTQMQYQDPLDPQDNSEYLAQMAQFTTLEIMENLGFANEMTEANGMIGKIITATDQNGKVVVGKVDGTKVVSGEVYLRVNDTDIELGKVQAVTGAEVESTVDYTKLTYANSLVGKIVAGSKVTEGEDGEIIKNDFNAIVNSSQIDKDGKITLKCYSLADATPVDVTLEEISEVTEMVPAEEEILSYIKELYSIMTTTNESADKIEEELEGVTE